MSSKKPDEQGFSLLEVIVALAIMSVGFVTILQLFSGSIRAVGMSEEYLKGIALANNKISELELVDFVTKKFSGQFENEEDYNWELHVKPYDTPLNREDANIRVFEVNLEVFWEQSGKRRNVTFVTLQTHGNTYPAADSILLGLRKAGNRGNVTGSGANDDSDTESENTPESDENATENISGVATDGGDISGLRVGAPQVNLSGAGVR